MGEIDVNEETSITSIVSAMPYDQWMVLNPQSSRPAARYKHAAEVIMDKLFVIGGSRNGRYLADIQSFDLRTLKWSTFYPTVDSNNATSHQAFPPTARHSVVRWNNKLVVIAGNSKVPTDSVSVWLINAKENSLSAVNTTGQVPSARGGQSVSLYGSKLILFGGEDNKRRLLNDIYILDLETMTWEAVETKNLGPAARYDHTAVVYADQYLLIYGGSSTSTCFNDLHLLDLQTMEWSHPHTLGAVVTPRSGHAGTFIDENWYIVGGGDNFSGSTDTLVLNTSRFVWSVVSTVSARDALASEGITVCSTMINGEDVAIAFGGYNGEYNNDIFIMKPKPRDCVQPRLVQSPAAAAAAASVSAAYAVIAANSERTIDVNVVDDSSCTKVQCGSSTKEIISEPNSVNKVIRGLEFKLADVQAENVRLREKLDVANLSYNELTKELKSVQSQLAAEGSRCQTLESQIRNAQERLESIASIEQKVEELRQLISQMERNMPSAQKQRSGSGVWQWMAGGPQVQADD